MKSTSRFTNIIFLAMIAGIAIGYLFPGQSQSLHILSDIFLRLIKMVIAPLVFSTLVVGIAKLGGFKTVGRIGVKTMLYFQFATILSLTTGLVIVNTFEPGHKMHLALPPAGTDTGLTTTKMNGVSDFVDHLIPKSFAEAMAKNEILQIVVFSLFSDFADRTTCCISVCF